MKKRLHRLYRDCILVLWDSLIISMIAISHLLALSLLLEVTPKYLDLIQNCFLSRRYNAHNFLPFSAVSKIWPISVGSVNCTQAGRTHEDTSFIFTSLARNSSSIMISWVGFPQYVGSTEEKTKKFENHWPCVVTRLEPLDQEARLSHLSFSVTKTKSLQENPHIITLIGDKWPQNKLNRFSDVVIVLQKQTNNNWLLLIFCC